MAAVIGKKGYNPGHLTALTDCWALTVCGVVVKSVRIMKTVLRDRLRFLPIIAAAAAYLAVNRLCSREGDGGCIPSLR